MVPDTKDRTGRVLRIAPEPCGALACLRDNRRGATFEIIKTVAAYVISEVETQGQRYRELAAASIARHGGRYLVRGAAPVVAEGDWAAGCRRAGGEDLWRERASEPHHRLVP